MHEKYQPPRGETDFRWLGTAGAIVTAENLCVNDFQEGITDP